MTPLPSASHLMEVWLDMQRPDFYWQVLAFAVCLSIAWFVARRFSRLLATAAGGSAPLQALLAQAFPLAAALFLILARIFLAPWLPSYLLAAGVPVFLSLAGVRAIRHMLEQSIASTAWLKSLSGLASFIVWGWLALYLTGASDELVAILSTFTFSLGAKTVNLWMILSGAAALVLTLLAALWLSSLVEARLEQNPAIDSSLKIVFSRFSKALCLAISILTGLSLMGIDVTALSVFTGALGVGLGLGLQKIASNYVSGFILLLDHSIKLGHIIDLGGGTAGVVDRITTRYTVLKSLAEEEFIVPNETLVSSIVKNQTWSNSKMRVAIAIGVAYESDLEQVATILEAAAAAHPRVLPAPPPRALLADFADSSVNFELGFWIDDPQNGSGLLRSQIRHEIWKRLNAAGVEIPFPQQEVRVKGEIALAGTGKAKQ